MQHANPDQDTSVTDEHYRFDNVSFKLILDDMRFSDKGVKPGQTLPNLTLFKTNGEPVQLHDLCTDKPLLLVTGSVTCPMTISAGPGISEILAKSKNKLHVALIYVREAHPGEMCPQPQSLEQKIARARQFEGSYGPDVEVLIDGINGELHHLLDLMPNSAHLIDTNGRLCFQSLFASDARAIEEAVNAMSTGMPIEKSQSQRMLLPMLGAAGYMDETFEFAGPRAQREMMKSAFPIYLWSRLSSLFFFLPKRHRGMFGLLTMLGVIAAVVWGIVEFT